MKKKIIFVGVACFLLVGCNGTGTKDTVTTPSTEPVAASESANQESGPKTVMPLPVKYTDNASDKMPDGEYSVSLDAKSLEKTENGYQVTLEFYQYDRYIAADIDNLKSGDSIQLKGELVEVSKVTENKDRDGKVLSISVNGGTEEGGFDLLLLGGEYRTTSLDDVPLYYSIGKGTLPISKEVVIKDCIDYEKLPDGVTSGFKELPENITGDDAEYWTQANTTVKIKDNQIVRIDRHWTP